MSVLGQFQNNSKCDSVQPDGNLIRVQGFKMHGSAI